MADNRDNHNLAEQLRRYASTPEPDPRFVERLERRLLAEESPTAPAVGGGALGSLRGWWQRWAQARQRLFSAAGAAAGLILLLAGAALFASWIGALSEENSASPITGSRPATRRVQVLVDSLREAGASVAAEQDGSTQNIFNDLFGEDVSTLWRLTVDGSLVYVYAFDEQGAAQLAAASVGDAGRELFLTLGDGSSRTLHLDYEAGVQPAYWRQGPFILTLVDEDPRAVALLDQQFGPRLGEMGLAAQTPTPPPTPTPSPAALAGPITPTPPTARDFPIHAERAVLVALQDDLPISQAEFARLGIETVAGPDGLAAQMQVQPVEIIYLHPAVFRDMPEQAVRELYESGVLLVILDVPASEISGKLPVFSGYEDLRPETFADEERFVAAAVLLEDDLEDGSSGYWTQRDFYTVEQWWLLVSQVEGHLRSLAYQLRVTEAARPGEMTPTPTPAPLGAPLEMTPTATPVAPTAPARVGEEVTPTPPPTPTLFPGTLAPPTVASPG